MSKTPLSSVCKQPSPQEQFPDLIWRPWIVQLRETTPFPSNISQTICAVGLHQIAVPLMKKVKEELENMEKLGDIRKVSEPTEWCTSIVVVPKPSGRVHICVDLTKLNKCVLTERHQLPVIDQTLAQLAGGKVHILSKLDSNSGLWQIPLSSQSSCHSLTTFIMPFGHFCLQRLPFGIS